MEKPKFQIGDQVWRAATLTRPVQYTCLECAGAGFITVILGDQTRVTIQCECCKRGHLGSDGTHQKFSHYEAAEVGTIGGVEVDGDSFEYRIPSGTGGSWCMKEADLFLDEASASVRAQELAAERTRMESELRCRKYKEDRSWAWNVKYHRDAIRRAQDDIARHTESLNYAQVRAKAVA